MGRTRFLWIAILLLALWVPLVTAQDETAEPTDEMTEMVTEEPTEEPTEAATEEPTEAATEEPTEAATEEPTEAATEEPTEAATEEATEEPTEEATEEPTETATQNPAPPSNNGIRPGNASYRVQRGDTLFSIATDFGTTVEAIATANNIVNVSSVFVGQLLEIPGRNNEVTPQPPPATGGPDGGTEEPEPEPATHIVQRGDNLFRVALRYDTTIERLVELNPSVTNVNLIFVGQRLVIP